MSHYNWTDVAQAVGGIATAILSYFVWVQTRKVKTLTDVVNILSEANNLQAELTLAQRIPLLRLTNRELFNAGGPHFYLWYENVGKPFHNIKALVVQGDVTVADGFWDYEHEISNNLTSTKMVFRVTFPEFENRGHPTYAFVFYVFYETDDGDAYRQICSCDESRRLVLTKPELSNDKVAIENATKLSW